MKDNEKLTEAAHLQAIESNPLDAEDIALFERFEREDLSPEDRRAEILAQASAMVSAAE